MYLPKLFIAFFTFLFASVESNSNLNITASCTITDYSQVASVITSCTNIVVSNLRVPANKQLNLNLREGTTVTFHGTTIFDVGTLDDWLMTISGNQLTVKGEQGSVIHGQGEHYWDGHGGTGGKTKPKLLHINNVNNAKFQNINLKNCPMFCTGINKATDVTIDGWHADVSAGDKLGKNTDGIGISGSHNIYINNAYIHNQDQCVYVNQGSNMLFTNIHCVNSHGICAKAGYNPTHYDSNTTKNITFRNCVMERGFDGIRLCAMVKPGGGPGEISDITYDNIELKGITRYGIWVEMDYGNTGHPNNNLSLTNLKISNVHGTVSSKARAVYIECGKKCSNWTFSNIDIKGSHAKNACNFEPTGFKC